MLYRYYINILRRQGDEDGMGRYLREEVPPEYVGSILDDMESVGDPTAHPYFLDRATYNDYLNSLVVSVDSPESIDEFVRGCCLSLGLDYMSITVEDALGLIHSMRAQVSDLRSRFPEHSVPQVEHCPSYVAFAGSYQLQSSIQCLADAFHESWAKVLAEPVDICLQCLDYLSAKSSAEYLDFKFRQSKQ